MRKVSIGGFTTSQIARLTAVPYTTLDYWARTGFLKPSISNPRGKGSDRFYSFNDIVAIRVAQEFRQIGVSLQGLRSVIRFLTRGRNLENPLAESRLVVVGKDVLLVNSHEQLVSVLERPGQGVMSFVVDLAKTVADLKKGLRKNVGVTRRKVL